MSILPTLGTEEYNNLHLDEISNQLKELLGKEKIPSAIRILGHYKPALKIYAELLEGNFKQGKIPALTKQMILLAILNARGCKHCSLFISHICEVAGIKEDMLQLLNEDLANLPNDLTRPVVKFGVKCATDSVHVNDSDYTQLKKHGIGDEEIMEILSLAAFANYVTTLSETLKLK